MFFCDLDELKKIIEYKNYVFKCGKLILIVGRMLKI